MSKPQLFGLLLAGVGVTALAQPYETAKVLSATPVITQVPHQVCDNTLVASPVPKSGAGAAMGAIAGGVVGNALSHGAGNAATTALGVMGGAILGDKIEGQPTVVQSTPSCTQQLMQVTMYQVEYELNGKRYSAQMPQDPGPTLSVQVAPVPVPTAQAMAPATYAAPVYSQPPVYAAPPVYVAPYPYGYPVAPYSYYRYPPVGISLGFGYYRHH